MKQVLTKLRYYFLSGLVVFLPLALTIYLFVLAIETTDSLLGKYLEPIFHEQFGFYFRGISILIGIYLIILIGFFVTHFLGKKLYEYFESILVKLPFFRQVYPAIKEMAIFLFSRDRLKSFKQAVILEYPRKGVYAVGFLTNDAAESLTSKIGKDMCNVFIPSAPGPLTGYLVMVPRKDLIFTDVSIEEAFKFIVSGGVVNPK